MDFNIYLHTLDIFLEVLGIFVHDFRRGSSPKELSLHLMARYSGNDGLAASVYQPNAAPEPEHRVTKVLHAHSQ